MDYYIILFSILASIFGIQVGVELRRITRAKENNNNTKCVYCGLPVGKKFSMSYGWPGKLQIVKCRRWWCNLGKKFGYLTPKNYNNQEGI